MRRSMAVTPILGGGWGGRWWAQDKLHGQPSTSSFRCSRLCPSPDGYPEPTRCHSERSEDSRSASGDSVNKDQGEIPRSARNDTQLQSRAIRLGMFGFVLAALLLYAGCSRSMIPPEPPAPKGIVDLDEAAWEKVRTEHYGRVLLVNFWATWCDPCREEFPNLVRLHNTYRGRGLSVVAISMDDLETVPAIQRFLQSQGAKFGSYRQHFGDFEALVNSINPRWGGGIPATFLYDREGKLVNSWEGATTYEEFECAVKPLLP